MSKLRYQIEYTCQVGPFHPRTCHNIVRVRREIRSEADIREIEKVIHAGECQNLSRQMRENGFGALSASPYSKDNPDLRIKLTKYQLLK